MHKRSPIVKNVPVALQDDIDRNRGKQLLRGRVGYVDSWILHDDEESTFKKGKRILPRPPRVVFVRFKEPVEENGQVTW